MKRFFPLLSLLLLLALLLGGCTLRSEELVPEPESTPEPTEEPAPPPEPLPYSSLVVGETPEYTTCASYDAVFQMWEELSATAEPAFSLPVSDSEHSSGAFTSVLEGDTLFVLSDRELIAIHADGENSEILSRITAGIPWAGSSDETGALLSGGEKIPFALFAGTDRLVVLSDRYSYEGMAGNGAGLAYTEYTALDIYNIEEPSAPELIASLGQDGFFRGADIQDGVFTLWTEYSPTEDASASDITSFVPELYGPNGKRPAELTCYRDTMSRDAGSFAVLTSCRLSDGAPTGECVCPGVSPDSVFIGDTLYISRRCEREKHSRSYTWGEKDYDETAHGLATELYAVTSGGKVRAVTLSGALVSPAAIALRGDRLCCLTVVENYRTVHISGETADRREDEETGYTLQLLRSDLTPASSVFCPASSGELCCVGFTAEKALLTYAGAEEGGGETLAFDYSEPDAPTAAPLAEPLRFRVLLDSADGAMASFDSEEPGALNLRLLAADGSLLAERRFGSDHSGTMESRNSYLSDPTRNWIGFGADDSFCLYTPEKGDFAFLQSFYLKDWIWNARPFLTDSVLYLADTREVLVRSAEDFSALADLTF